MTTKTTRMRTTTRTTTATNVILLRLSILFLICWSQAADTTTTSAGHHHHHLRGLQLGGNIFNRQQQQQQNSALCPVDNPQQSGDTTCTELGLQCYYGEATCCNETLATVMVRVCLRGVSCLSLCGCCCCCCCCSRFFWKTKMHASLHTTFFNPDIRTSCAPSLSL